MNISLKPSKEKKQLFDALKRLMETPPSEEAVLTLAPGQYLLEETAVITRPMTMMGDGAEILVTAPTALALRSSSVKLQGATFRGGILTVTMDAAGSTAEHLHVIACRFLDYVQGALFVGSTVSGSVLRDIRVIDSVFEALKRYEPNGRPQVSTCDLFLTAALGMNGNVDDALLEDVLVDRCTISGPSVCNLMIVPGLALVPENTPQFNRCGIRGLTVTNCRLTGSDDTAVAAQANYINNNDSWFEDLDISHNVCVFGLTGLSASAGSPMDGSCDGIVMRNVRINDNVLEGKPDVGEMRTAIGVGAGGINYRSCSCYRSRVENTEICRNSIRSCERGICVGGASSMVDSDAPTELIGNVVENTRIQENCLTDVEVCFQFLGLCIEGRRFDWNWGKYHTTQFWLPEIRDHSKPALQARDNHIRNLLCENNQCSGFSYLLRAVGAQARGHGVVSGNTVSDRIVFRNNGYEHGENHICVADTVLEDWVRDEGGNQVDSSLKDTV